MKLMESLPSLPSYSASKPSAWDMAMTSLAAAGVVVVVTAEDFSLEADDFELASVWPPGASDPRPIETYRDLWCIVGQSPNTIQLHCQGLTRSIPNGAKEQRLEQRLRKVLDLR